MQLRLDAPSKPISFTRVKFKSNTLLSNESALEPYERLISFDERSSPLQLYQTLDTQEQ